MGSDAFAPSFEDSNLPNAQAISVTVAMIHYDREVLLGGVFGAFDLAEAMKKDLFARVLLRLTKRLTIEDWAGAALVWSLFAAPIVASVVMPMSRTRRRPGDFTFSSWEYPGPLSQSPSSTVST
jgi:hypothetical protein